MNHKLESSLLGEIWTNIIYADDGKKHRNSNDRKQRETKEPLDEGEREEWNVGLKLNIQKTKIMASGPITSWQTDGKTMEIVADFIFLGSKSLWTLTAAMELKDACSLEEKQWQT